MPAPKIEPTKKRECDLAGPVMDWLKERGFSVFGECRWYNRSIDVVGLTDEAIEAVELKMSLTKHVIYQAHLNQLTANRSWCAVATKPRNFLSRLHHGIGLLAVVNGRVEVLREADASPVTSLGWTRQLRGVCHYKEQGGEAGLPTQRGIGPAQDVYRAVQNYRADNPNAKWSEIFEKVPNHYAHSRSMQGAMSIVAGRIARRTTETSHA